MKLDLKPFFVRQIAVPTDHGSWVFLISPLLIGLFAGGRWKLASLYLVLAVMAAFLMRQPVTVAVKAYAGRRSRRDLPAARFWMVMYAALGLLAVMGLIWQGYAWVLVLALPGAPVFAWHLWLVSRRQERRQAGVEILATGVLALAAPAAYWVGAGRLEAAGWWLLALTWLQSAASIVHAYLRLEQRELKQAPQVPVRLRMARRALLYTSFNLAAVIGLGLAGVVSAWLWAPYALQWLETLYGTFRPAVGAKPVRIGLRQLLVSTLFTILFILLW
jgi:hypothetical protein